MTLEENLKIGLWQKNIKFYLYMQCDTSADWFDMKVRIWNYFGIMSYVIVTHNIIIECSAFF